MRIDLNSVLRLARWRRANLQDTQVADALAGLERRLASIEASQIDAAQAAAVRKVPRGAAALLFTGAVAASSPVD